MCRGGLYARPRKGANPSPTPPSYTSSGGLDNLRDLRLAIEEAIPVGFNCHDAPVWNTHVFEDAHRTLAHQVLHLFAEFSNLTPEVQDLHARAARQIGTLGGGNHFIELCLDTDQRVWLMLHSGSRNIGKSLAEIRMGRAKHLPHNARLPDRDLAVFLAGTPEMAAYRRDLYWAQRYAFANRSVMLTLYQDLLRQFFWNVSFEKPVLCHHNYVAEETHFGEELVVTRKGAIRAGAGELGIIPGSMGAKSFIVRGRGNAESFCSASHGAGRRMSRSAAKRRFTAADLAAQTAGVECRKDTDVVDEIPAAYKDIAEVMANQADLVEVAAELKQVLYVKG